MKLSIRSSVRRVLGERGARPREHRAGHPAPSAPRFAAGILRKPRAVALALIAFLVTTASFVSFAESYRGLYLWAQHHDLSGPWAALWPVQVDTFVAVGELSLFVGLVDGWSRRSRVAGWLVAAVGLAVSVGGNIGHVAGHSLTVRATAAIPPLAAASALAVGLGVLKRTVGQHHAAVAATDAVTAAPGDVPADAQSAALIALKATLAAGNPLSGRQLETRFGLTRAEATRVRELAMSGQNGQQAENN